LVVRAVKVHTEKILAFRYFLQSGYFLDLVATALQTAWRAHRAYVQYKAKRSAAIKIQAAVRGAAVPTRSRHGAFSVRWLWSEVRVVRRDKQLKLSRLAPIGAQAGQDDLQIQVIDLRRLSMRQRRLLAMYIKPISTFVLTKW
jgi:hypothetical protein